MASISNNCESMVNNSKHSLRNKLQLKMDLVNKDLYQLKLTVKDILSEIEMKSSQASLLSSTLSDKDGEEMSLQLDSLHMKLTSLKYEITKNGFYSMKNGESFDSNVNAFKRKLNISTPVKCEAEIQENTFEIDSSPESGDETLHSNNQMNHISNHKLSSLSASSMSESFTTESGETIEYDLEADLKWQNNLFNFKPNFEETTEENDKISSKSSLIDNIVQTITADKEIIPQVSNKICNIPRIPTGKVIAVSVAYVVNPSLFWLHYNPQINNEILTKLQKTQNKLFRSNNWRVKEVQRNMFVAAMYSKDSFWYRAQIINILGKNTSNKLEFEVLYIDYGNTEILPEDDITVLSEEFLDYEPQAVRCCLSHISEATEWSKESIDLFRSILERSVCLGGHFFAGMASKDGHMLYSVEVFDDTKNIVDLLPNHRNV